MGLVAHVRHCQRHDAVVQSNLRTGEEVRSSPRRSESSMGRYLLGSKNLRAFQRPSMNSLIWLAIKLSLTSFEIGCFTRARNLPICGSV
jgi:hypothetical protein